MRRRIAPNASRPIPRRANEEGSGTLVGTVAWKLSAVIVVKSRSPTDVANVAAATESVPVVDDKAVLRP